MKTAIIAAVLCWAGFAFAQEQQAAPAIDATSYIELLRTDIKAQKNKLMSDGMALAEEDAQVFWPLYREYTFELDKQSDELLALLKEYAQNYENLTSQKAEELATRSFALQERKLKLRKDYFEKFRKVLPPKLAARYLQLDNRINLLYDLQLAARVPLVK
ncbi:MAG: hypothetical protein ACREOO_24355 [bacterium]